LSFLSVFGRFRNTQKMFEALNRENGLGHAKLARRVPAEHARMRGIGADANETRLFLARHRQTQVAALG
jgi:hypothetical protein